MSAYETIVVGTDGSESSMKAVERAGALAGEGAQLVIACAYFPPNERGAGEAADILKDEAYQSPARRRPRRSCGPRRNVRPRPEPPPSCSAPPSRVLRSTRCSSS